MNIISEQTIFDYIEIEELGDLERLVLKIIEISISLWYIVYR